MLWGGKNKKTKITRLKRSASSVIFSLFFCVSPKSTPVDLKSSRPPRKSEERGWLNKLKSECLVKLSPSCRCLCFALCLTLRGGSPKTHKTRHHHASTYDDDTQSDRMGKWNFCERRKTIIYNFFSIQIIPLSSLSRLHSSSRRVRTRSSAGKLKREGRQCLVTNFIKNKSWEFCNFFEPFAIRREFNFAARSMWNSLFEKKNRISTSHKA